MRNLSSKYLNDSPVTSEFRRVLGKTLKSLAAFTENELSIIDFILAVAVGLIEGTTHDRPLLFDVVVLIFNRSSSKFGTTPEIIL